MKNRGLDSYVNPVNGKEIHPIAEFHVLSSYVVGCGAYGCTPAHDERDWEFAKQLGLPIVEVLLKVET